MLIPISSHSRRSDSSSSLLLTDRAHKSARIKTHLTSSQKLAALLSLVFPRSQIRSHRQHIAALAAASFLLTGPHTLTARSSSTHLNPHLSVSASASNDAVKASVPKRFGLSRFSCFRSLTFRLRALGSSSPPGDSENLQHRRLSPWLDPRLNRWVP